MASVWSVGVSLTSQLGQRRNPLREFFEARMPNLKGVQARWRECGPAGIAPLGAPPGTMGMAFDYRLRYLFAVTSPRDFLACQGAAELAGALPDRGDPERDPSMCFALGTDLYGRLSEELTGLVDRVRPVGRRLAAAEEAELCRHCYVLALYEQFYRAGVRWDSPLGRMDPAASAADALALVPDVAVRDLCVLVEGLHASELAGWVGRAIVANPVFSGSRLVGGADGDLIVDNCLIDVKVSASRCPDRDWVYQLLGYALLDLDDVLGIERVALYHARGPALMTWGLQELVDEAAQSPVDLSALRAAFRVVLSLQGSD